MLRTNLPSNSSRISNFVKAIAENPLTIFVCLSKTKSNQPHLLFLPVVTPNSAPRFCKSSPIAYSWKKEKKIYIKEKLEIKKKKRINYMIQYFH